MRLAGLVIFAVAAPVYADPSDIVSRPLVLASHQVDVELTAEIDLAPGEVARGISLAPDVWFGLTDRWTVGIVQSNLSVDQIKPGSSFCVRKEDIGCDQFYHGGGVDLRWGALSGELAVAPRARLLIRDIDFHNSDSTSLYGAAWKPALTLGSQLRWTHGRYAISADPYLQLGLANTDLGNRAALFLPIAFAIQPTCRWALELHTGWNSDLAIISDGWYVPVEAGVRARATEHIDVVGAVGFYSLLGPQNAPKERATFLTIAWRS